MGVLEHDAIVVESLTGDHRQTIVVAQLQVGFIGGGDMFHGHGSSAGDDQHFQFIFNIFIYGGLGDGFRETGNKRLQKKVCIKNQRFTIQIPDTADIVQFISRLKASPAGETFITGGLILGFRNCIDSLYLFENGTKTLCDLSQFWTGVDSFLWLIGEAIFHMLPVGIC